MHKTGIAEKEIERKMNESKILVERKRATKKREKRTRSGIKIRKVERQ